jgi:hypothetical protein
MGQESRILTLCVPDTRSAKMPIFQSMSLLNQRLRSNWIDGSHPFGNFPETLTARHVSSLSFQSFRGFTFRNFATPMTLILYSLESPVSEIPVDSPISSTCPPQMDGPDHFGTSPVAKTKDSLLCFPMFESPI